MVRAREKGVEYGTVSVLHALVQGVTGTAAAAIGPGEGVSFRSVDGPRVFTTALASHSRRGLVVLPVPRGTPHPGARYGQGSVREAQSSRRARTASSTRLP